MALNTTNPGEVDEGWLARAIAQKNALGQVSGVSTLADAQRMYTTAQASKDDATVEALEQRATIMGWNLVTESGGSEATQARSLLIDVLNLALTSPGTVAAAENVDTRFSPDAAANERGLRIKASINDLTAQVGVIVNRMQRLATTADARANAATPTFNPNDALQLTRTAQAWEFTIKPVLERDSLTNWGPLLDALDLDGLFAIQRFVPGWVKTQPATAALQSGLQQILDGAASRIPLAITDQATINILNNAAQTNDYLNRATSIATSVGAIKNSNDANAIKGVVQRASVYAGVAADIVWPTSGPQF